MPDIMIANGIGMIVDIFINNTFTDSEYNGWYDNVSMRQNKWRKYHWKLNLLKNSIFERAIDNLGTKIWLYNINNR